MIYAMTVLNVLCQHDRVINVGSSILYSFIPCLSHTSSSSDTRFDEPFCGTKTMAVITWQLSHIVYKTCLNCWALIVLTPPAIPCIIVKNHNERCNSQWYSYLTMYVDKPVILSQHTKFINCKIMQNFLQYIKVSTGIVYTIHSVYQSLHNPKLRYQQLRIWNVWNQIFFSKLMIPWLFRVVYLED